MPSSYKTIIQLRHDTFENWSTNDPVLKKGEFAAYTKEGKTYARVGDGTSQFSQLTDIGNWDAKYTIADITDLSDYAGSTHGLVPEGQGSTTKFLREDGSWETPVDKDTWVANTADVAGYVAAGGLDNANKVWRTDETGEPAWRDEVPAYTLPAATEEALGGVKSGGDITVDAEGNVTVNGKAAEDHTHEAFTRTTDGFVPNPGEGETTNRFLCEDGNWAVPPDKDTWTELVGATEEGEGTAGYAPAPPMEGYNTKFLGADGTWKEVPGSTPPKAGAGITVVESTISRDHVVKDGDVAAVNEIIAAAEGASVKVYLEGTFTAGTITGKAGVHSIIDCSNIASAEAAIDIDVPDGGAVTIEGLTSTLTTAISIATTSAGYISIRKCFFNSENSIEGVISDAGSTAKINITDNIFNSGGTALKSSSELRSRMRFDGNMLVSGMNCMESDSTVLDVTYNNVM